MTIYNCTHSVKQKQPNCNSKYVEADCGLSKVLGHFFQRLFIELLSYLRRALMARGEELSELFFCSFELFVEF